MDNSTQAVKEAHYMLTTFDDILRQSQREFGDLLDFKIELIQSKGQFDRLLNPKIKTKPRFKVRSLYNKDIA